uniref:Alternative protein MUC19 n=1 Tax=Homo sapiens TaxID=9606 RepID=L0R8A0_HUMAN|nr:alternative protein MUC19 [Homo sapiens]
MISYSWNIHAFAAEKKTMNSETLYLTVLMAVQSLTNTSISRPALV